MWIDYAVRQGAGIFATLARMLPLATANRYSQRAIPAEVTDQVIISLTTHGGRLKYVHYAIESVARGNICAPIVLWLDPADYHSEWPESLRRLEGRGLTVRCSDGEFGPHTKYWGTFRELAGTGTRVVTIDDDMIYPAWFLERLLFIAQMRSDCVIPYRAHRIGLRDGQLEPYRKWTAANTSRASLLHFATGVSGVLYPTSFIEYVVSQGERFLEVAPRADDVWLHVCALRSQHRIRQVYAAPRPFTVVPLAQTHALVMGNTFRGGNDRQIALAYGQEDVDKLVEISAKED